MTRGRSIEFSIVRPSTERMMSPVLIPALSAGLFGSTALTRRPALSSTEGIGQLLGHALDGDPQPPAADLAVLLKSVLTFIATSMGTANDNPM